MIFLKGKKTYILVAIATLVFIGARIGWIDPLAEENIYLLLGIGTVGTIRSAIK